MSKSEDCTKTTETGNTKIEEYKTAGEKFMNLQMGLINRIYSMEEFQAQCENKFMWMQNEGILIGFFNISSSNLDFWLAYEYLGGKCPLKDI